MKKITAILLSTFVLLGLAACGGKTVSSSTAASGTNSAESTENTSSASVVSTKGKTIDEIKAAGKITMLTNATFPPFEYISNDGHSGYDGVDIQLAKLIADEIGVELEVGNYDFGALIPMLQSGKGDIIAAGMSINDERKQSVDFSVLYVDTSLHIIVPTGSDIKSEEDLTGLKISVQESTTSDLYVSDTIEAGEVMRFKNAVDAGAAVANGKADVCVIDNLTGTNIIANTGGKLAMLEEAVANDQYAMAIAKDNPELLELVNKVLSAAVAEDKVNTLLAEHMAKATN